MGEDAYQRLIVVFREEANEQLGELLGVLQRLGEASETETAQLALAGMRLAHNVKGAASSVGVGALADVAHALEDALEQVGADSGRATGELIAQARAAVTTMQRLAEGSSVSDDQQVADRLRELAGAPKALVHPRDKPRERAPVVQDAPPTDALAEVPEAIRSTTVRVETQRLDDLMRHATELIGVEAELEHGHDRLERFYETLIRYQQRVPDDTDVGSLVLEATEIVGLQQSLRLRFVRTNSALGESVRRMRLVPITALAPGWQRCVVETQNALRKDATLVIDAGDVELDKEVLDKLRDPIIHLLRNALDHGIETPEERRQAGKDPQGNIRLSARSTGATVRIEIGDDGRGIDASKVRRAAVEKRLRTTEELAAMSDSDVVRLILEPGFSTTARVGAVSGRGVGLDVVRRAVEQFGGRVDVAAAGRTGGATFLLEVPVNVMSSRGLMVRAGATTYFLPIEGVERATKAARDDLRDVAGSLALQLEGSDPVRVKRLAALLGEKSSQQLGALQVAVLRRGDLRLGIIVDEILGDQELVINKLPWNLKAIPGVTGTAILPDGTLALALDVGHLLRSAAADQTIMQDRRKESGKRVLVVDDSLTARTLQRNTLISAGYEVTMATDGMQAWTTLTQGEYDLLVSDVQMPGLDGFQLTERVRAHERFRNLPVVLVTSRGTAEDVERGLAAGADEYVVKGPLQQAKLLEAVARHL